MSKEELICGICGAKDVKIYRPYGNFYRPKDNRCNNCVTETQRGFYVPCIKDSDGAIWGFLSASEELMNTFYTLPESNIEKPVWQKPDWGKKGGWPDNL